MKKFTTTGMEIPVAGKSSYSIAGAAEIGGAGIGNRGRALMETITEVLWLRRDSKRDLEKRQGK